MLIPQSPVRLLVPVEVDRRSNIEQIHFYAGMRVRCGRWMMVMCQPNANTKQTTKEYVVLPLSTTNVTALLFDFRCRAKHY